MKECFAGNCATICDNSAISNELKMICDTGSQRYCTTGNNIYKPECRSYLTRVIGNSTADRTGKIYANPIRIPVSTDISKPTQTAKDYYNALSLATISLPIDNRTLIGTDTAELINILKSNDPDYATTTLFMTLIKRAFDYCSLDPNPDTTFCSETTAAKSWATLDMNMIVKEMTRTMTNRSDIWKFVKDSVIQKDYKNYKLLFTRMPSASKPLADIILNTLIKDDLIDPDLIKLRALSPYFQIGVDTFVINLINVPNNGVARERLISNGSMYNISLTNPDNLYGSTFRTFLANLRAYNVTNNITTDPFITLVNTTDNSNISICSTGNPLGNPLCTQVSNAVGSNNATTILNAAVSHCSNANNVKDPICISHVNSNQTIYNLNDVNTKMLNYCLSTNGQNDNNCKPFSALSGSNQWLANSTKNTTDAAGNTSTVCGTTGNLSKDVCRNVCTTYPTICASDTNAKCSTSTYRYSNNVDFFQGTRKEPLDIIPNSDSAWFDWLIFIIFAIFCIMLVAAGIFIVGNSNKYQYYKYGRFNTTATNK